MSIKEEQDKISIIIPIYNVEEYLKKCVMSVLHQTYRNLEIILVDDGSPDNCGAICEKFALADSRVKVIHKKNGGLSEARNYGIDLASGDYIGFVDSDDWIENDMLEVLHSKAAEYKADIAVCGFYIVKNNQVNISQVAERDILYTKEEALTELVRETVSNHAWNKLYKRELFSDIRYPSGCVYEDIATTYKLFAKSSWILSIKDSKYYYLSRASSIMNQKNVSYKCDLYHARWQQYTDLSKVLPDMSRLLYERTVNLAIYAYNLALEDPTADKRLKKCILEDIKRISKEKVRYTLGLSDGLKLGLVTGYPGLYSLVFCLGRRMKACKRLLGFLNNIFLAYFEYKSLTTVQKKQVKPPVIYLIGTPEHHNLGDHAIAYAEKQFLKEKFPDNSILELSDQNLIPRMSVRKKLINKSDIIACHGGGNIGNLYLTYERQRRWVIKHFPNNRIFIFPQTIFFTQDALGLRELQKTKRVYNRHKNLTLAAREQYSYDFARKYFPDVNILLTPDIVLYLKVINDNSKRKGALLCLRDDIERVLTQWEAKRIKKCLEKHYDEVIRTDTYVDYRISASYRSLELEAKWFQFGKAELVVTDRIHGMIFAALTGTPCIALNNSNHKIEGTYQWMKNISYIKFISSADELEPVIMQLQKLLPGELHYDVERMKSCFDIITDSLRSVPFNEAAGREQVSMS